MKIEQLMTTDVATCDARESAAHAAQLMMEHDCGCVPIVDGGAGQGRVIGMVTDRDICLAGYREAKPLHKIPIREVMSAEVCSCGPDDSAYDAERVMRDRQLRRLPVLDDRGVLVGMLSLGDLAQQAASSRATGRPQISEAEVGDTLASISRPVPPATSH